METSAVEELIFLTALIVNVLIGYTQRQLMAIKNHL